MASQKTPAARLAEMIGAVLDEYAEGVQDDLAGVTNKIAKAGAKALRAASRTTFGGSGEYAKGWTVETGTTKHRQIVAEATIYNKIPGLPHLLEYGHANWNGGRTPGHPHIAPVEKQIVESYENAVRGVLSK